MKVYVLEWKSKRFSDESIKSPSAQKNIGNHLKALSDFLDSHFSRYEKILILGNFNVEADDQNMKTFCDIYSLTSLIKQPTCYKNTWHPKCIDLILTNVPRNRNYKLSNYMRNRNRVIIFPFDDINCHEKTF